MARVVPFRPFRYSEKAGDPSNLVTQPYDKIPDSLREKYLARSPYSFVRLNKGKADSEHPDVYARAAELLDQWIRDGILVEDPKPAFYAYSQAFSHPETGAPIVRQGFIGLTELEEYDTEVVHRHELTHRGPKLDRLQLTEATQAHFGQLFLLYDDPTRRIDELLREASTGKPLIEANEEGVAHKVWAIDQPGPIAEIQQIMADKKLMIADGHHRYETALAYSLAQPDVPGASRVMLTLVNMSSEGLLVLATHRLISGLADFSPSEILARVAERFEIAQLAASDLEQALNEKPKREAAIGLVLAGDEAAYLLTPKAPTNQLDVVLLHDTLLGEALGISAEDVHELKGIEYVRGLENAVAAARNGRAQVAFLLRPVDVKEVAEISFSGGVMPQKSTDFYPKLLSGLTTYRFGRPTTKAPKD